MGLQRYTAIGFRANVATAVVHNAPRALKEEIQGLQFAVDSPVVAQARKSRIPFVWQPGLGGTWHDVNGDCGYRCGVAAASWDGSGSGCILMLSCSDESIPNAHVTTLQAYSLTAAVLIGAAMGKLVCASASESPFAPEELHCMLYTLAGLSAKEAARGLGISIRSVHQYLENARARIGVKTSYAAATMALRHGWLDLQQASELASSGSAAAGSGKVGGF